MAALLRDLIHVSYFNSSCFVNKTESNWLRKQQQQQQQGLSVGGQPPARHVRWLESSPQEEV